MLREAKNRAIVAIQLSDGDASAWIGGIDEGMNARPPLLPRKLSLARTLGG
jgi:hypothetical protein